MGFIVFVTDKHKGPQVEMSQEEVRNFPINLDQGTWYRFPDEISVEELFPADSEISDKVIRIEPSDDLVIEQQERLKQIISGQQKHIMRLERLLHEKGVSGDEISALSKGEDG
jgi:hypothetical protein